MSAPQIIAASVMAVGVIGYAVVAALPGRKFTIRDRTIVLPKVVNLPLRAHAIAQVSGIVGWAALLWWGGFWS